MVIKHIHSIQRDIPHQLCSQEQDRRKLIISGHFSAEMNRGTFLLMTAWSFHEGQVTTSSPLSHEGSQLPSVRRQSKQHLLVVTARIAAVDGLQAQSGSHGESSSAPSESLSLSDTGEAYPMWNSPLHTVNVLLPLVNE